MLLDLNKYLLLNMMQRIYFCLCFKYFPQQHRNNLRGCEYTHNVMTKGILYLRMVFNVRFPC